MSNRVKVIDLEFDGHGRLRMDLQGHATEVIELSRQLAALVLGATFWRLTSIEGKITNDDAILDSDMKFKIIAETKEKV